MCNSMWVRTKLGRCVVIVFYSTHACIMYTCLHPTTHPSIHTHPCIHPCIHTCTQLAQYALEHASGVLVRLLNATHQLRFPMASLVDPVLQFSMCESVPFCDSAICTYCMFAHCDAPPIHFLCLCSPSPPTHLCPPLQIFAIGLQILELSQLQQRLSWLFQPSSPLTLFLCSSFQPYVYVVSVFNYLYHFQHHFTCSTF